MSIRQSQIVEGADHGSTRGRSEDPPKLGLNMSTSAPLANYVPAVRTGNLVYLSGHGPVVDGSLIRGKLGADLDIEAGYAAARRGDGAAARLAAS